MKPKNVKTENDICKMRRDNWSYGDFCIGFNGADQLYIHEQRLGKPLKQSILIPKKVFNFFSRKFSEDSK